MTREQRETIADSLGVGGGKVEQIKIVRCVECKFYTGTYCHHKMQYGLSVTESDYCSKGERKDG